MSDKIYVGSRASSLEKGGEFEPISRVTMRVDNEHYYTAGDDTGRTLERDNPWATQQIVDNVLKQLKGFVYRPFKATDVRLDPGVELGDAVTIGGIYSIIAQMDTKFDAAGLSTISAPGEKEIDHEYPYLDPTARELKRRVKLGQKYQGVSIDRRNGLTIVEVQEDGGEGAKVVLNSKELTFYDAGGGRVLYFDPTSGTYKFLGELNVNDKFVVDRDGNVILAGNIYMTGDITWGKGPVQYKFAPAMTGPWHDTMEENDKYRRDSLDGGTTWGDPYQFRGEDGRDGLDGSDATVPAYITQTVISKGVIQAPRINANDFSVYPSDELDYDGSFNIYGQQGAGQYHMFAIKYQGQSGAYNPVVEMYSPGGADFYIAGGPGSGTGTLYLGKTEGYTPTHQNVHLCGKIDLSEGTVVNWGDNYPVARFG